MWLLKTLLSVYIDYNMSDVVLLQLHRNHIGLPWPVTEPALSQRKVEVLVDIGSNEIDDEKCILSRLSSFHGHMCDSLKALENLFTSYIWADSWKKDLSIMHFNILQTSMRSHTKGSEMWFKASSSCIYYRKFPKYSDTQKNCCNHPKSWTRWRNLRVIHPKDAERMANNVDPDQTAPLGAVWSGSALFAQTCLSENLGKLRYLSDKKRLWRDCADAQACLRLSPML